MFSAALVGTAGAAGCYALFHAMDASTRERLDSGFPGRWRWDDPPTPERLAAGYGGAAAAGAVTHAAWAWGLGWVIKPSPLSEYRAGEAAREATRPRLESKFAKPAPAPKVPSKATQQLSRLLRVHGRRHGIAFVMAVMTAGAVKPYFEGPYCRAPPEEEQEAVRRMEFVEQLRRK